MNKRHAMACKLQWGSFGLSGKHAIPHWIGVLLNQ